MRNIIGVVVLLGAIMIMVPGVAKMVVGPSLVGYFAFGVSLGVPLVFSDVSVAGPATVANITVNTTTNNAMAAQVLKRAARAGKQCKPFNASFDIGDTESWDCTPHVAGVRYSNERRSGSVSIREQTFGAWGKLSYETRTLEYYPNPPYPETNAQHARGGGGGAW